MERILASTGGSEGNAAQGRALVPVRSERRKRRRGTGERAFVPFLAQLIAAADKLPQACERRRADPQAAVTLYSARLEAMSGRGHTLLRLT
jgi:hypothetical protein